MRVGSELRKRHDERRAKRKRWKRGKTRIKKVRERSRRRKTRKRRKGRFVDMCVVLCRVSEISL